MNWFKKLIAGSEYARQQELLESYRSQIKDLDSKLKDFDKMKLRLTIYEECSGMKEGVEAAIEKITQEQVKKGQDRLMAFAAASQNMNGYGLSGLIGQRQSLQSIAAQSVFNFIGGR